MWEVTCTKTQNKEQTTAIAHDIMAQTTKPELARYYQDELFSPTKTNLLKVIKQVFLKT